jgi:ferrous iron transport protein A
MLRRILKKISTHSLLPGKPRALLSLSEARCGERLRVVGVRPSSKSYVRLKELGFCESAVVCKVTNGSALICQVCGVRLAIGRDLGADVLVEHLAP